MFVKFYKTKKNAMPAPLRQKCEEGLISRFWQDPSMRLPAQKVRSRSPGDSASSVLALLCPFTSLPLISPLTP